MTYDTQTIATRFTELLKAELGPENWKAMLAKLALTQFASPICPSHDYCDSNMPMGQAMEESGIVHDPASQEQADLWNEAWDIARASWESEAQS